MFVEKVWNVAGGWVVSEVGDRGGLSQPQKTGCTSRQRNKCIVLCGGFFLEGKVTHHPSFGHHEDRVMQMTAGGPASNTLKIVTLSWGCAVQWGMQ